MHSQGLPQGSYIPYGRPLALFTCKTKWEVQERYMKRKELGILAGCKAMQMFAAKTLTDLVSRLVGRDST